METENKKTTQRLGKHRLSLDLPQETFDLLKKTTEEQDTTITRYVYRAIMTRLRLENEKWKKYLDFYFGFNVCIFRHTFFIIYFSKKIFKD